MSVSDILATADAKRLASDPEYFEDTRATLAEALALESEGDTFAAFAVGMDRANEMLMERAF